VALRGRLGDLDQRIVELIAERSAWSPTLPGKRAASDSAIRDSDRERQVLAAVEHIARNRGRAGQPRATHLSRPPRRIGEPAVSSLSGLQREVAMRRPRCGVATRSAFSRRRSICRRVRSTAELIVERRPTRPAFDALKAGDVRPRGPADREHRRGERRRDLRSAAPRTRCRSSVRRRRASNLPLRCQRHTHWARSTQVSPRSMVSSSAPAFSRHFPPQSQILHFDTGAGDAARQRGRGFHACRHPCASRLRPLTAWWVLRRGIANHAENYTRFVVLARHPMPVELSAPCKTSLILIGRHEQGAFDANPSGFSPRAVTR